MLIKLDNGILLNLSVVSYISNTEMVAYFEKPVIKSEGDFRTYKCYGVGVTEADIERIASITVNKEVADNEL